LQSFIFGGSVLNVFGNDYDTHDGTCIRDYVHVNDLSRAHLLGLEYMKSNKGFSAFNLGNGNGFSVLEVIESCENVVRATIPYKFDSKRLGDPARLVADSSAAMRELGWKPELDGLDEIVASALRWHTSRRS
jgi:UDP-glucose 4-epimerase